MSTKGKPAYTRTSNQSYPPIAAAQPSAVQSFPRTQQRYPQQTVPSQTVQLGMQPLRMQYPSQHVAVIPPNIIQTAPSQNQVRAFIPTQSSPFVPSVHSSSFESNHYPYVFGQGAAFYQPQAVTQPINYQTTSGQQISQNVTGTQHMQIQTNQSTHGSSQSASVQPQIPSTWPDTKKTKVKIKITDPNQGGKDVTDEILKIKKENSAELSASPFQVSEKIKAEFAAMVAAAKDGKKEEQRATKETSKDYTEDINDLHGKNDVQSLTPNEFKTDQGIDDIIDGDVVTSRQLVAPKTESCLNVEGESENVNLINQDIMVTTAEGVSASENYHKNSEQNELEKEYALCDEDGGQSIAHTDSIQTSENDKEHNGIIASSEEDNSCSEPGLITVADDSNKPDVIGDGIELCSTSAASKTEEIIQTHADEDSSGPQVSEPEVIKKDNASEFVKVLMNADGQEKSDIEETEGREPGFDKVASFQVASKRKKPKQRMKEISSRGTRDSDLMSAFTDRPEEEDEFLENVKESISEELPAVEDTWENKEIKIDSMEKSEKRIIYDREFLLGFQFSKEKPKDLPDIELVLPEAHPPTKPIDKSSRTQHSSHHDLMPQFMRQSSGNRQIGSGRGGKGSRTLPAKKIIPTSFETKVELKKAENAWVRPSEQVTEGQEQPIDELYRKARGILNKLTPQKFPRLVEQMKNLDIDTAEKLRGVIDIIFEKALSEPGFSAAYAKLCDEISRQKIQLESGKGSNITFKRILLNKCQAEFEKEKTDEQQLEKEQTKHFENAEEERVWQEELRDRKHKAKKRSLGNIRFIGELFKLKMLTEAIMHTCVVKLLRDGDEESLECLCQLLTTIGKDLDVEKAKQRTDQYFEQISKVIQQRKVCSRVIFMLQNIQELRATNWVARRVADAPKTIDEIHKEAKQEEIEMQMAHQQAAQKRVLNKAGGRESPAVARSMQGTEEGWNHVPLSNKSNRPIQQVDPSKLKLTKRTDSDNISLGPGGRHGAWAQGASGGSSRFGGMQPSEDTRQGNRFQALSSGENASRQDNKNRGSSRSNQQAGRSGRPGGPPASTRRSQQQQIEEKAAALESVRRIVGDQTKPNSRSNSAAKLLEEDKHGNISSEDSAEVADNEQNSSVEPPADKVKKETKLTIEEFIMNRDLKEAENCIQELHSVTQNHLIISEALNIAVEKKYEDVKAIGMLLHSFVRTKLIPMVAFKTGLKEILEFADDISVDIPHIWTNLGIILAFLVVDSLLSLSELSTLIEPLIHCNTAAPLMAHILAAASEISGKDAVASIWHESGLNWRALLKDENDAANFITKHGMEFTVINEEGTMNSELFSLLKDSCTCETAVEWIEKRPLQKSDSYFVSNLCGVVLNVGVQKDNSSIKFDCNAVKNYKALLVKYIGNDATKQLNALFAAQNLAAILDHPQDFLKMVFEVLYDEDIISADSILKWEESEEQPQGKGVAIESVKQLLQWLKTNDDYRSK